MTRTGHTCPGPLVYEHSRFTGAFVARCTRCRYVCGYWDATDLDPDTGRLPDDHPEVVL